MAATCRTCKMWAPEFVGSPEIGECRAHPPTFMGEGYAYPEVHEGDWCGEHKEKEGVGRLMDLGKYMQAFKVPKNIRLNLEFRKRIVKASRKDRGLQQELWIACARDPLFYLNVFGYTYNPKDKVREPNIPFVTWAFQDLALEKMFGSLGKHDVVIAKSRDIGASWLCLFVFYHSWHFLPMQTFLMVSRVEDLVDKKNDPDSLFWKALTLDTPVLTPSGFVMNGDLSVGDNVIGSDGLSKRVNAVVDHGERDVFRVSFSDGTDIRCCGDHLWMVTTTSGRQSSLTRETGICPTLTMNTRDLAKGWRIPSTDTSPGMHRYQVGQPAPVMFSGDDELPIAPYTMGALLGDGCLSKHSTELAGIDDQIFRRVAAEVPDGVTLKRAGDASKQLVGGNGRIGKRIKKLGLKGKRAWEKFIPNQFKMASYQARLDLLRGIMDTDGWVVARSGKRGVASYSYLEVTSKQLAEDVQFVVRSLGGYCTKIRSYDRFYTYNGERKQGRKAYRFGITMPVNPFWVDRKASLYVERPVPHKVIVGIEPDGTAPVRCISVESDDHLYAIDGFVLTHNCDHFTKNEPKWLIPNLQRQKLSLYNHDNGSSIIGASTTGETSRGGRKTAILFDEFASVDDGYAMLSASRDATNTRFLNSTPKGTGNAFADQWEQFPDEWKIRMHWSDHPIKRKGMYQVEEGKLKILEGRVLRDFDYIHDGKLRSPWYDMQRKRAASDQEIAQELDIDFHRSGWSFFDPDVLANLRDKTRAPYHFGEMIFEHPMKSTFLESDGGRMKLWCNVDARGTPPTDREYIVGCDVATGKGGKYSSQSALSVLDKLTGEKVGEFATPSMDPAAFGQYAVAVCNWFKGVSTAFLIWEDNGPGGQFGKAVLETGYRRFFYRQNEASLVKKKQNIPGFWTQKQTKRVLLGEYGTALKAGKFINRSWEAIEECAEYTHMPSGDIVHMKGASAVDPTVRGENHGDIVIADALAWRAAREVSVAEKKPVETMPLNCIARRQAERETVSDSPETMWR